ncbi:MAG: dienelactone hydrolase family protein [Lautropia sp.]
MKCEWIELSSADGGRVGAYVADPGGTAPGLVLLQYICGVNEVMQRLARTFADQGFRVAVPDLFWRQQPRVALANDPATASAEDQKRALALNQAFQDAPAVDDMRTTLAWLRAHPRAGGKVGALGYCLGGRMAYLLAARSDVDCAVGYYGVNIDRYLDEVAAIDTPLLLHMAANDVLVPLTQREKICAALAPNANITVSVHAGVDHAFALEGGPNFDAAAATRANDASLAFLEAHLR